MVEFNALMAAPAGWTSTQLYDLLCSYGYQAYELKKRKLVPFEKGDLSAPDFCANLIFQHRS